MSACMQACPHLSSLTRLQEPWVSKEPLVGIAEPAPTMLNMQVPTHRGTSWLFL